MGEAKRRQANDPNWDKTRQPKEGTASNHTQHHRRVPVPDYLRAMSKQPKPGMEMVGIVSDSAKETPIRITCKCGAGIELIEHTELIANDKGRVSFDCNACGGPVRHFSKNIDGVTFYPSQVTMIDAEES